MNFRRYNLTESNTERERDKKHGEEKKKKTRRVSPRGKTCT